METPLKKVHPVRRKRKLARLSWANILFATGFTHRTGCTVVPIVRCFRRLSLKLVLKTAQALPQLRLNAITIPAAFLSMLLMAAPA